MRRYLVMAGLVVGLALAGARQSHADTVTTPTPDLCVLPNGTLAGCIETPTATPTSTVVPEAQLSPVKTMSVGSPSDGPAGTTLYPVTVTSQLACFSLSEPVDVNLLGNASAAVISELSPDNVPSTGTHLAVKVDPATGQAQLALEVLGSAVGPGGLDLKAFWPAENVEIFQNIVPPAPATATPTLQPGQATDTPQPTATPGDTPTPIATSTPIPVGPTSGVQACVQPEVMPGVTLAPSGADAVLYGLTVPGSTCTAAVTYYQTFNFPDFGDTFITGLSRPVSFLGTAQTATLNGVVAYPWTEQSMGNFGIGTVTCTPPGGKSQTACSAFLIAQQNTQYLDSFTQTQLSNVLHHLESAHCPAGSTLAH